jgi:hypothetical protein
MRYTVLTSFAPVGGAGFSSITILIPSRSRPEDVYTLPDVRLQGRKQDALERLLRDIVLFHALLCMPADGHMTELSDVAVKMGHMNFWRAGAGISYFDRYVLYHKVPTGPVNLASYAVSGRVRKRIEEVFGWTDSRWFSQDPSPWSRPHRLDVHADDHCLQPSPAASWVSR